MAPKFCTMLDFVRNHPIVSCFTLLLFTPQVFRLMLFFSPLLVSTALCILALISWGPNPDGQNKREKGDKIDEWAVGLSGHKNESEKAAKKLEDGYELKWGMKRAERGGEIWMNSHFLLGGVEYQEGTSQRAEEEHRDEEAHAAISGETVDGARVKQDAEECVVDHAEPDPDLCRTESEAGSVRVPTTDHSLVEEASVVVVSEVLHDTSADGDDALAREAPKDEEKELAADGDDDLVREKPKDEEKELAPDGVGDDALVTPKDEEKELAANLSIGEIPPTQQQESDSKSTSISSADHELAEREEMLLQKLSAAAMEKGPSPTEKASLAKANPLMGNSHRQKKKQAEQEAGNLQQQDPSSQDHSKHHSKAQGAGLEACASALRELFPDEAFDGGFHSSFDPWESSIWGRDPIQEETSIPMAQTA